MADAFTGFAGKAAWKLYGPRPGIHIVRFWQGIVEIALRATVIVSPRKLSILPCTKGCLNLEAGLYSPAVDVYAYGRSGRRGNWLLAAALYCGLKSASNGEMLTTEIPIVEKVNVCGESLRP